MHQVATQVVDKVFEIKLNRPEKRNAFGPEMIEELTQAFRAASRMEGLRAVYLHGEGQSFCAGADLEWMKSMVKFSENENKIDSEKLFEMFAAGLNCPTPILTRVHGHVMGGALGLLAISDIVIAEESTNFAFSEVKIGLAPAVISYFVLSKMNPCAAQRFMLTGERFDCRQAEKAGLVSFVGPKNECLDMVKSMIADFYQNGPEAVRATKKLIREIQSHKGIDVKNRTTQVIAERRVSLEGQEGLNGFLNKTPIHWKLEYKG